jgi:hypothetical protein
MIMKASCDVDRSARSDTDNEGVTAVAQCARQVLSVARERAFYAGG